MKIRIFVKCEDANHICDKNQYKESPLKDRIKLIFHIIYCRACRKYSFSNHKLTTLVRKSNLETIKESEKYKMRVLFEKELSKSK